MTTPERIAQEHILDWETLLEVRYPACSRAAGRPVRTTLSILDLGGVTLSRFNATRAVVQSLLQARGRAGGAVHPPAVSWELCAPQCFARPQPQRPSVR